MNKKVSELAAAAGTAANDLLLLVQNSITKHLTIEKLFGGITVPVTIKSTLNYGSVPDIVTTGAIPLNTAVTHINLSSVQTLTIGAGKEGQIKFLIVVSGTGESSIEENLMNGATMVLDSIGDSVQLLYTNGRWAYVGGNAVVVG